NPRRTGEPVRKEGHSILRQGSAKLTRKVQDNISPFAGAPRRITRVVECRCVLADECFCAVENNFQRKDAPGHSRNTDCVKKPARARRPCRLIVAALAVCEVITPRRKSIIQLHDVVKLTPLVGDKTRRVEPPLENGGAEDSATREVVRDISIQDA